MEFQQVIALLIQVNEKYNSILQNAKTIDELDEQLTLVPTSYIHVRNGGVSEKLQIEKIINSILLFSINQLLSIGEITVDGNDITIPAGAQWQISGVTYFTSADTILNIPFSDTGNTRIDIIVANVSGTMVKITGTETTGIAVRPNIPLNTVLVTQINVTEDSFGAVVSGLTIDEYLAIHESNGPSESNPFATMADITAGSTLTPFYSIQTYTSSSVFNLGVPVIPMVVMLNNGRFLNKDTEWTISGADITILYELEAGDTIAVNGFQGTIPTPTPTPGEFGSEFATEFEQ